MRLTRSLFRKTPWIVAVAILLSVSAFAILIGPSVFAFTNGQNASLVLGQSTFTTNAVADTQSGVALNRLDHSGVTFDDFGNLWVADTENNRVLEFMCTDSSSSSYPCTNGAKASLVLGQSTFTTNAVADTQSGMHAPTGIVFDSLGSLWVADSGNNRVLEFTTTTTTVTRTITSTTESPTTFTLTHTTTRTTTTESPTTTTLTQTKTTTKTTTSTRAITVTSTTTATQTEAQENLEQLNQSLVPGTADCGMTVPIPNDTAVVLTGNIGPCSGNGLSIVDNLNPEVLDCNGYTISGSGVGVGINLTDDTGVTVESCTVTGFSNGFLLNNTAFSTLVSNTAKKSTNYGFLVSGSYDNTISENTADNNGRDGFLLNSSSYNILTVNMADSNDASCGFCLLSSSSNTLIGNTAKSNGWVGFWLGNSNYNFFLSNTADKNGLSNPNQGYGVGFYLCGEEAPLCSSQPSTNNTFRGNTADNNGWYGYEDYSTGPAGSPTYGTANDYGISSPSVLTGGNTYNGNGHMGTDPFSAPNPF